MTPEVKELLDALEGMVCRYSEIMHTEKKSGLYRFTGGHALREAIMLLEKYGRVERMAVGALFRFLPQSSPPPPALPKLCPKTSAS
jgi:hypothetical protein